MKVGPSIVAAVLGVVLTAPVALAQGGVRAGRASSSAEIAAKQQSTPVAPPVEVKPPARPGLGRPGPGRLGPGGRGAAELPAPDAMAPNQVDQWFDTYVIFQAQAFLNLNDAQWLTFGQKVKNLQSIRRRVQKQRHDTLAALRQVLQTTGAIDEAAVSEKLRVFDDLSAQAAPEVRQAYMDIDKLLNPRQRVRFRLFEEQMEQKKMDLIALARQRQQGRGNQAPQGIVKK